MTAGSADLAKLVEGLLVDVERSGRKRLAGPAEAAAMETLAAIAPSRPVRSLREATRGELLREGRTCYDHLAGRLGVELTSALERRGFLRRLDRAYRLTPSGRRTLEELGVDVARARARRREFAFACLDWSERRPHLAGALGAALAERLFALGWVERVGPGRAAALTEAGRNGLESGLGVAVATVV